jgi:hypothetical protein
VGVQRQEELPIREARRQPVRGVHREGSLADPGHPVDHVNPHHAASRGQAVHRAEQLRELSAAAGEAGDIARQRPGRRRGGPGRLSRPGRQHLGGRSPPAGRGDEQRTRRLSQAQRIGQQPGGLLMGGAVDAPLQVTDRPRAHGGRLGQLLLGQPGLGPQLPQQAGERKRRLLRHTPTPLQTPPGPPARRGQDLTQQYTDPTPQASPASRARQPPPTPPSPLLTAPIPAGEGAPFL